MSGIYILNMSFNFLIQATRVLNLGTYEDDELDMIYEYVINVDRETLSEYQKTCAIISYNNDLELYVEILESMIKIFEDKEEYEKCEIIMGKKEEAKKILN